MCEALDRLLIFLTGKINDFSVCVSVKCFHVADDAAARIVARGIKRNRHLRFR